MRRAAFSLLLASMLAITAGAQPGVRAEAAAPVAEPRSHDADRDDANANLLIPRRTRIVIEYARVALA